MTKDKEKGLGRPTVMTDDTVQQLLQAFGWGCTDEEACYFAGISRSTLFNYQNENPDFLDKKTRLKERPVLLARRTVVDNLEASPELSLKFLERKKKDEFSLRSEITNKDGKPLEIKWIDDD